MSMLTFISVALDKVASRQLSTLVGKSQDIEQMWSASRVLFGMGIIVSLLQLQILMSRVLQDRRKEFVLLSAVGTSTPKVVLLATVEHTGTTLIGVGFGILGCAVVALLALLAGDSGIPTGMNWFGPVLFATVLPVAAVIPITTILVRHYCQIK